MTFSLLLLLPCALLTVATSAAAFVGLVTTSSATTALAATTAFATIALTSA